MMGRLRGDSQRLMGRSAGTFGPIANVRFAAAKPSPRSITMMATVPEDVQG
jgi:hypothetical protein